MTTLDAPSSDLGTSQLPTARGPLSESVLEYVTGRSGRLWSHRGEALLDDPDAQVALWILNCVDVALAAEVDVDRVRSLPLRALHWTLERSFEHEVQRAVAAVPADTELQDVLDELLRSPAVDLAATAGQHGAEAVRDVFLAKAPYLGFEADPHTLALARLESPLKSAMAEVQAGEYGVGHGRTHAEIYRSCLAGLGCTYRDAVEAAPTASFAFANLAWLFGRDVRWRGAAVGQLCLLELDSVEPCRSQVRAWDAVGLPEAARRWYDIHVLADAEHERIIRERLVPAVASATPWLVADATFGATATWILQQRVAQELVEGWRAG